MLLFRRFAASLLSLAAACLLAQNAQAQSWASIPSPPVTADAIGPVLPQELFLARRLAAVISPSGHYLALVQRVNEKDRLSVIDLVKHTRREIFNDQRMDVSTLSGVFWKGDDRLIFRHSGYRLDRDARGALKTRKHGGGEEVSKVTLEERDVLYSVLRESGGGARLSAFGSSSSTSGAHRVIDTLEGDPDHILVVQGLAYEGVLYAMAGAPMSLLRMDVRTGAVVVVEEATRQTVGWETDRKGLAIIRYDQVGRRGSLQVMGRTEGESVWRELYTMREKDTPALADFEFLGATAQPGKVYVAAKPKDRSQGDTRELRIYDFTTKTLGEKLWSDPKYDLTSIIQYEDDWKVAAACYWAETFRCQYLDKKVQAEFAAVDRFFDGQRNIAQLSQSADGGMQVLGVSGPDEPGSLYLYDRAKGKVDLIGPQWPRLTPDRLGVMTPWRWAAQDGVELGGYLTAPPPAMKATGPLPLIVMPHGGPERRDNFEFDRWGQAFATRGYLVFQPNFRGSGGFGANFAEAGYGQWGLRMQDDVIDGVEALIKAGKVDPNRICIVGGSYGGYVALQGGARRPDLFKCVVSRAGLSDLIRSQKSEQESSDADSLTYKYWLKSIGDPKADKDRLIATSPITYAKTYGPPVLLLHGDADYNVPVEQSRVMEKALKAAGRSVKLIEYKGEGHGGWEEIHDVEGLAEMLAFVDEHIGTKK